MDILKKVKKTMLLTKEQKEKILNSQLNESDIKMLEEFFDKYEKEEINLQSQINKKNTSILINMIRHIEDKERKKILEDLKRIEKQLEKL